MLKKYETRIPLSREDSFNLLLKSASGISAWKVNKADRKDGYIEWKQNFWSLTGTAAISARLKRSGDKKTIVTIEVYKPLQIVDPAGICEKIFTKLDKAWQKNLEDYQDQE